MVAAAAAREYPRPDCLSRARHIMNLHALCIAPVAAFVIFSGVAFAEPPKMDVYGDPLPAGAVARLRTVRWRADGPIAVAAMLGPKQALTVTDNSLVQIWDLESGRESRRFEGSVSTGAPAEDLLARRLSYLRPTVALSRDGKHLVT